MPHATASLPFSASAARRRAFRAAVQRALRQLWTRLRQAGERRAARELALFVETHGERFPELARLAKPASDDTRAA